MENRRKKADKGFIQVFGSVQFIKIKAITDFHVYEEILIEYKEKSIVIHVNAEYCSLKHLW